MLHDIGGNRSVVSVNQPVLVDLLGRDGALLRRGKWLVEHEDSCRADCAFNLWIRHLSVLHSDDDGYFHQPRWSPLLVFTCSEYMADEHEGSSLAARAFTL